MLPVEKGRYRVRFASNRADVEAAQRLRGLAFRGDINTFDRDAYDEACDHVLIETGEAAKLVCTYRLLTLESGKDVKQSYSSQFYGLSSLESYADPMVEMGRFCVHPDHTDPDIIRVAWAAMTRFVDEQNIGMMFGCSSFHGTAVDKYLDSFSLLKERHIAPSRWLPRVKSPRIFPFAGRKLRKPNLKMAAKMMPPLLRTYLMMGGWVSDHAVVDSDLNTLHVFTGVEVNAIPPARKKLLRAVAS